MSGPTIPRLDRSRPAPVPPSSSSSPFGPSAPSAPSAPSGLDAAAVREGLLRDGWVRLPDLGVRTAAALAAVRDALGLAAAAPAEDFAPRTDLGSGVTTAPEWDADREMCLHHERSYGVDLPGVLLFACPRPAATGGATLLADTRAVLAALPPALAGRFAGHGWELVRNFRPYFGLPWGTAHGTTDPGELAARLAARDVTADWRADGTLHTTQRRPAVVRHPVTGERCWFNELAFFSGWSVDPAEREVLLATFGPDGIPFTTGAGDGTPLDRDDFQAVLDAYDAVAVHHEWRPGDVLVLDNVLTAHGRTPYTGERTLLVAPAATVPHPGLS